MFLPGDRQERWLGVHHLHFVVGGVCVCFCSKYSEVFSWKVRMEEIGHSTSALLSVSGNQMSQDICEMRTGR